MDYRPQSGDLYLCDSPRFASKMVKFLMAEPTVWHLLFKYIFKRNELLENYPRYYHAGMILDTQNFVEQQGKVQIRPISDILNRTCIIYRKKSLTSTNKILLISRATDDVGEGYGISECIGKLFGWIFGIKYFSKWFDMKNRAICIIRCLEWYSGIDNFGLDNPNYGTTKTVDIYCSTNPDWEVVYKN